MASSEATTKFHDIIVKRDLDFPPNEVFDAFSNEDIGIWWGPEGFTTTTDEMNFREGGFWKFTMHGPDGVDYKNHIKYTEIQKPKRLLYEQRENEDSEILFYGETIFEDRNGRTRITHRLRFPSKDEYDEAIKNGAEKGGRETFARLEEYLRELQNT